MKSIFEVFDGLSRADSPAAYIFEHPVLLSSAWQGILSASLRTPTGVETLARLTGLTGSIEADPRRYPIGPGPIEKIFAQNRRGEITRVRALEVAASSEIFSLLSPFYVRLVSINAEGNAQNNDWRTAVTVEQLILSALDARRGQIEVDQAEMDFIAVVHWLDIVARAVWEVPDGGLFRDALRRGENLARIVDDPGGFYSPAEILNRLGILHLDPYVYARLNEDYEQQWRQWQARLDQVRSQDMAGAATDEDRIPRPEIALPKAVEYLRRAAPHRSGIKRGLTLKALVQALVWQRAVGMAPDSSEVESVAREALRLIPQRGHEESRAEIENLLQWNAMESGKRQTADAAMLKKARTMLSQSPDQKVSRDDAQTAIQLFMQTASAVSSHPDLALKLWLAVTSLIQDQDEQLQATYYAAGQSYVRLALSPEKLPAEGQPLAMRVTAAQALKLGTYHTAAMIFALAVVSGRTNEEEAGAEALAVATRVDPGFATQFQSLLLFTRGVLRHNAAVSAFQQNKLGDAARLYMVSAYDMLVIGHPRRALDAFEDALDLTHDSDEGAIRSVVALIGEVAVKLEQQLGDLVAYRLQVAYRELLARTTRTGVGINPVVLLLLWQAAKGNAFSHALASGTPLSWLETESARRMEEGIRDLAAQVAPEPWGLFDESMLLTSFVTSEERHGGNTAGGRLRNLQITFDTEVNRQLVIQDGSAESWYLTDKTLQAALEPSSVLLAQYLGALSSGSPAYFTLFATKEELGLTAGEVPNLFSGAVVFADRADGSVSSSPFAAYVETVRKSVQEESGPRSTSGEALDSFQSDEAAFFGGGLVQKLAEFKKAGKNHLCICPFGPFHFYPYHLIGTEDHPLSEEWIVTYLPNLRLLEQSHHTAEHRDDLVVIGLDFAAGNSRGLCELSGPQAEAIEIAAVTGCPSLTGSAVTRSAVMDVLDRYRRIHIATHGDLEVSAPSFQCLYLSGDAGGDLINAYEILRLNLRGVDLVTLSACETALGRFDLGDNLRGIPANLLIAGVSTIVGTLWPVETNTARLFFTSFYSHLKGSVTKGEAFHSAQKETRNKFPQYRDWGAFYLIGAIV